ncbi:MAG: hypothetical protein IKU26_06050 [Clostridia bacterium]|nr:hypothetical protein [Clostridia bacterium]
MKIQKSIAIFLTLICICSCLSACASSDYKAADKLFSDGKYEEAIAAFKALGNYKDSEHRIDEATYHWAKQLLNDGNWSESAKAARSIVTDDGELSNQIEQLLLRCDLKQAEELLLAGKSKQALEICQTVKKKTSNSSIIVAADALQKRCQEALSLGDANKLLENAQAEYQNKNWQTVIALCTEICEIAPDTELATTAENLQKQAEKEIETELSNLMTCLEDAYNNSEWSTVVEIAVTIINDYSDYVSNKETIEQKRSEAAQKLQEQVNEKLGPALEKLNKEYDEVEKTTWYMPSSEPRYINDYCVSYLYIGDREGRSPWLRWRTIYVDDEWLYFDALIINVDGTVYSVNCNYDDTVRDSNRKNHWEYVDFQPKSSQLDIIRAIINSENTVIRFSNDDDDKIYDYTVSKKEKEGFKDVLEAFELMQYKQ